MLLLKLSDEKHSTAVMSLSGETSAQFDAELLGSEWQGNGRITRIFNHI